jgi:large subunit ribosomal protein L20
MRVKRGVAAHKRRKNLLQHAKGFMWRRKSNFKVVKEALLHAWSHAYSDRRKKKRDFRTLWQVQINAGARQNGMSYSRLIDALKKKNIELDRKSLADLAQSNPETFAHIINLVK